MPHRFRLLTAGLAAALAGGALGAAPAPAQADTTGHTAVYSCLPTALGLPLPPVVVPVDLDVLDQVTAPAGTVLAPVSGTLGIGDLVAALGGTIGNLLMTVDGLVVTLDGVSRPVTVSNVGGLTLPALPVPGVPGTFPVTLPSGFDISAPGGLMGGLLGTAHCTIVGLDDVVTTLVVPRATPGAGAGPVLPPGSHLAVSAARSNPCVATPAAKAGQRRTGLTAHAPRVSWKRRPAITVGVTTRHTPARGRVIACYGALKIGQRRLQHGRATLRTLRFHPGRHRVRLVYLGSVTSRPTARTIALRVRR